MTSAVVSCSFLTDLNNDATTVFLSTSLRCIQERTTIHPNHARGQGPCAGAMLSSHYHPLMAVVLMTGRTSISTPRDQN